MKKVCRWIAAGLTGMLILTGCGSEEIALKQVFTSDYSQYVKLGEYKGIEAKKVTFQITDEEVEQELDYRMQELAESEEITDRNAEPGDDVILDYTVIVDGQQVEELSGTEEQLRIGENAVLPEIDSHLIGMSTGETRQFQTVLDSDYVAEEYENSNADVTLTVSKIIKEVVPELTDAFVKEQLGYDSVEAFRDAVREDLVSERAENFRDNAISEIMAQIEETTTFEGYPDDLYQECSQTYQENVDFYAEMFGMTAEEYLEEMGVDEESQKEEILESVRYELIIGAIAQKEKLGCTKKEIDQFVKDNYEVYGYETEEEFRQEYTDNVIAYQISYDKVTQFLYENAKLTEISEEEYWGEDDAAEYIDEDEEYIDEDEEYADEDEELTEEDTSDEEYADEDEELTEEDSFDEEAADVDGEDA